MGQTGSKRLVHKRQVSSPSQSSIYIQVPLKISERLWYRTYDSYNEQKKENVDPDNKASKQTASNQMRIVLLEGVRGKASKVASMCKEPMGEHMPFRAMLSSADVHKVDNGFIVKHDVQSGGAVESIHRELHRLFCSFSKYAHSYKFTPFVKVLQCSSKAIQPVLKQKPMAEFRGPVGWLVKRIVIDDGNQKKYVRL